MKRTRSFWVSVILCVTLFVQLSLPAKAGNESSELLGISSPSVVLIEAHTGTVIYARNENEKRAPASITKIMTLLLTFEAIKEGKASLTDEITVSSYAASMGGSQVYLEEGEVQSLDTLIKCITVASGNDASVAVAEYISGSEKAFVDRMNRKAEELNLHGTHFEDCCGLSDSDNHYTTALDVAVIAKELTTLYPEVFDYSGIWMEDIYHVTRRGTEAFTLSSTNKLLKQSDLITGLKTGSTDKALYCICATATQNNVDLIAVVLGGPSSKDRFRDAMTLLNYGFRVTNIYRDDAVELNCEIPVRKGKEKSVEVVLEKPFYYVDIAGNSLQDVIRHEVLPDSIKAPVEAGEVLGYAEYICGGSVLGKVNIVAAADIAKAGFGDCLSMLFGKYLLAG